MKTIQLVTEPYWDFERRSPPTRYGSTAILNNDGTYTNICPAGIVTDPLDSSKFLFYLGEFLGWTTVGARISLHIGSNSNPYDLSTDYGVVLSGTADTDDVNGVRFGCVEQYGSTIYLYYVGIDANYKWRIFLATSTDGRTFTKQGMVLDYNDTDEKSVSDPSIIRYGGTWYMTYTGWDGATTPANHNPGRSRVGIKLATSSDGITWTKTGTVLVPLGAGGSYDDTNVEGGQLIKYGNTWVILYNCNDGSTWGIAKAYSTTIDAQFTKEASLYFSKSVSGWDNSFVATALIYQFTSSKVMYYQAFNNPNPGEEADIGAAILTIV